MSAKARFGDKRTRREAIALLGGAGLLAACGGKAKEDAPSAGEPTTAPPGPPTTPVPAPASVYPLTGMPITEPAKATRPAITVKIDNAPAARPQNGLDSADIIFEEAVEGGVVRFAAVFHSGDSGLIGPVRSVRAEDGALVTPLRGYLVYSGGSDVFNAIVQQAPVGILNEDLNPSFFNRRKDRRSPFNLYTSTETVHTKAPKRNEVPPAFFTYRPADQPLAGGAAPASEVTVTMGEKTTATWTYDAASKRWLRSTNGTPHVLESGPRLSFPNVVIQFCSYRPTTVIDSSGAVSPEAVIIGQGEAWVLSGPAMARGVWSKPDAAAVTRYSDASGKPLPFLPGPTWVSFAPVGLPTGVR